MVKIFYSIPLIALLFISNTFSQGSLNRNPAFESEIKANQKKIKKTFFIENKGQWPDEVKFLTRMGGLDAWITDKGIVYDFYQLERLKESADDRLLKADKFEEPKMGRRGHVVNMYFEKTNNIDDLNCKGIEKQTAYYNYFIGNDESKWASNVPLYKEVTIESIYEKIDLRYYYDDEGLRYDFIVHPGADLNEIKYTFDECYKVYLNSKGELTLSTSIGEVTQRRLLAYQEINGKKVTCQSKFMLDENEKVGFEAEWKNKNQPLIIDPLVYSTFLGGSNDDVAYGLSLDNQENVMITGYAFSSNYPTTVGAYDQTSNGSRDAFITKLNSTVTSLIFSTFLGGNNDEYGHIISLDIQGNAVITGNTFSLNFPTTTNAYDQTYNEGSDAFITKINSTGTALIYSTFLGGSGYDRGYGHTLDSQGNAVVTGYTYSSNFPISAGAYDDTHNGSSDVFITKLNSTGSTIIYSTFFGGSSDDYGYVLSLDSQKNAVFTGSTTSSNFPTTTDAYDQTRNGGSDAFVAKINSTGTSLIYSTFLGGSGDDRSYGIALDNQGNAVVTGYTYSSNFPISAGAFDQTHNGLSDAFITKLTSTCSALIYSTFLGGSDDDSGYGLSLDDQGNVVITNYTRSSDFPTTTGAYDQTHNGLTDAFITKLNSTGTSLIYSTFLGGNMFEIGYGLSLDSQGNAIVTGYTESSNFPAMVGAYDLTRNGGTDIFITKIRFPTFQLLITTPLGGEIWEGNTVHNISWYDIDIPSSNNIKIELSTDGGANWIALTTVQAGIGSYNFTVPPLNSSNCKIKVYWQENPSYVSITPGTFTITTSSAPRVTVTSPNGNEGLKAGSNYNITWYSSPGISNVKIELTTDNGVTWSTVTNSAPSTGTYNWTVPTIQSEKCRIRISSISTPTIYDVSDAVFRIKTLNLTSPLGGEVWRAGTSQTISWNSSGIQNIKIEYSTSGGTNWTTIANSVSAPTLSYNWTVPSVSSDQCFIRITDASDATMNTQNVTAFRIWRTESASRTPVVGNNTLDFGTAKITLQMFVFTAAQITSSYFVYESPQTGALPTGVQSVGSYYWNVSAPGISFINGKISIPIASLPSGTNPWALVWLKRTNPGDAWTNIGGNVTDSKLESTALFNSLSEFAIGSTDDSNPLLLASPLSGGTGLIQPITLKWYSAQRAIKFRLIVARDSLFNNIVINDSTITDTIKVISGLEHLTKYYWRVSSSNTGGTSSHSAIYNFSTIGVPTTVTLINPSHNGINQPINILFTWTKALDQTASTRQAQSEIKLRRNGFDKPLTVSRYWFELVTDTISSANLLRDTIVADTSKQVNDLSYLTTYFWRVKAFNEASWGAFSNWSKFTTIIEKPSTPTLALPLNGAIGIAQPFTVKWFASQRAATYHLIIAKDSTFTNIVINDSTITDTIKVISGLEHLTKYYWRVSSSNIGGTSSTSDIYNFTTIGVPTTVTLVNPPHNGINQPINILFKWTKALDQTVRLKQIQRIEKIEKHQADKQLTVSRYWFELVTDTISSANLLRDTIVADTSKQVNDLSYLTTYFWRVKAFNEAGWGAFSSWNKFTTIIEKPAAPTLVSPANNTINQPITLTLTWTVSERAEYYWLQVGTDSIFTDMIVNDSSLTVQNKQIITNNITKYWWRVRAKNIGGLSNWSASWNFTTIIALPSIPQLSFPLNNAKNLPRALSLNWSPSLRASKYRLQLATDSSFLTSLIDDSTLTTTTKSLSLLNYGQDYYWRLRAINVAGSSNWSDIRKFTIMEAPTLEHSINIKDNTSIPNSGDLIFGFAALASPGIDTVYGEFELPSTPPSGIFDIRFELPTTPIKCSRIDFRQDTVTTATWILKFQLGGGGYPITFSWDSTKFKIGGYFLRDLLTGSAVNINMGKANKYVLSNLDITSLKIFYDKNFVSVRDLSLPINYKLHQNFPNPFNPSTSIRFSLPERSRVKISIFNILGENINTLIEKELEIGYHEVKWNADSHSSGVYIIVMESNSLNSQRTFRAMKKGILLK